MDISEGVRMRKSFVTLAVTPCQWTIKVCSHSASTFAFVSTAMQIQVQRICMNPFGFFTNYTKMPVLAFSSLLHEKQKIFQ